MPKIIAYTYDADYHCPDCALKRFPMNIHRLSSAYNTDRTVAQSARDNEGNPVFPVFNTDETPPATSCGDCRAVITEPFHEQWLNALEKKERLTALEKSEADKHCIVIEVRGGCVVGVNNVPPGFTYQIIDYDNG